MSDMSNSDARKRAGQVTTFTDPYAGTRKPDEPVTAPRVARSIDDLRVGQVVVRRYGGEWGSVFPIDDASINYAFKGDPERVVILADPPAPLVADWLVPGEAMEALRKFARSQEAAGGNEPVGAMARKVILAARAVLDAAREVERDE